MPLAPALLRQTHLYELKASFIYIVNSRPTRDIQWDSVLIMLIIITKIISLRAD